MSFANIFQNMMERLADGVLPVPHHNHHHHHHHHYDDEDDYEDDYYDEDDWYPDYDDSYSDEDDDDEEQDDDESVNSEEYEDDPEGTICTGCGEVHKIRKKNKPSPFLHPQFVGKELTESQKKIKDVLSDLKEACIRLGSSEESYDLGYKQFQQLVGTDPPLYQMIMYGRMLVASIYTDAISPKIQVTINFTPAKTISSLSCTDIFCFATNIFWCRHMVAVLLLCLHKPFSILWHEDMRNIVEALDPNEMKKLILNKLFEDPSFAAELKGISPNVKIPDNSGATMKRLNLNNRALRSDSKRIVPKPLKLNFQKIPLKLTPKIEAHIEENMKTKAASQPLTTESLESEAVLPSESDQKKPHYLEGQYVDPILLVKNFTIFYSRFDKSNIKRCGSPFCDSAIIECACDRVKLKYMVLQYLSEVWRLWTFTSNRMDAINILLALTATVCIEGSSRKIISALTNNFIQVCENKWVMILLDMTGDDEQRKLIADKLELLDPRLSKVVKLARDPWNSEILAMINGEVEDDSETKRSIPFLEFRLQHLRDRGLLTEAQRLAELAMKTADSEEDIIFITCDDVHPIELFLFLRKVLEKKATNKEDTFKSFSIAGKVGSKILQKFVLDGIPQQHTDPEASTKEGQTPVSSLTAMSMRVLAQNLAEAESGDAKEVVLSLPEKFQTWLITDMFVFMFLNSVEDYVTLFTQADYFIMCNLFYEGMLLLEKAIEKMHINRPTNLEHQKTQLYLNISLKLGETGRAVNFLSKTIKKRDDLFDMARHIYQKKRVIHAINLAAKCLRLPTDYSSQSKFQIVNWILDVAKDDPKITQHEIQQKILENIKSTNEDIRMVFLLQDANKEEFSMAVAEQIIQQEGTPTDLNLLITPCFNYYKGKGDLDKAETFVFAALLKSPTVEAYDKVKPLFSTEGWKEKREVFFAKVRESESMEKAIKVKLLLHCGLADDTMKVISSCDKMIEKRRLLDSILRGVFDKSINITMLDDVLPVFISYAKKADTAPFLDLFRSMEDRRPDLAMVLMSAYMTKQAKQGKFSVDLLNRFKKIGRKAGYFGIIIGFLRSLLHLPSLSSRRSVILDQIASCPLNADIMETDEMTKDKYRQLYYAELANRPEAAPPIVLPDSSFSEADFERIKKRAKQPTQPQEEAESSNDTTAV